MSYQDKVAALGGTIIAVGLSSVVKLQTDSFRNGMAFKSLSGGSLEIVPLTISSTTGAGISGSWGTGYLMGSNEVMTLTGGAIVYLAAKGATALVACAITYSDGVSLPF